MAISMHNARSVCRCKCWKRITRRSRKINRFKYRFFNAIKPNYYNNNVINFTSFICFNMHAFILFVFRAYNFVVRFFFCIVTDSKQKRTCWNSIQNAFFPSFVFAVCSIMKFNNFVCNSYLDAILRMKIQKNYCSQSNSQFRKNDHNVMCSFDD